MTYVVVEKKTYSCNPIHSFSLRMEAEHITNTLYTEQLINLHFRQDLQDDGLE